MLSLCLTNYAPCYGDLWGNEIIVTPFLASSLDIDERPVSRPGRLISGERVAGLHWLGGCAVATAGSEAVILSGTELRPPALSPSL
jgi:hypothetical protein